MQFALTLRAGADLVSAPDGARCTVTWPATGARYPSASDPVTDPRGRPRVRWHDLLAGLDRAGYQVVRAGDPDVEITSITHDSRQVDPGTCFACIPGAVTDGHDHAADAVAAGRGRAARGTPAAARGRPGPGAERARGARTRRPPRCSATRRRRCACSASPAPTARRPPPPARGDRRDGAASRVGVIGTEACASAGTRRGVETRTPRPRRATCRRCSRGCATPACDTVAMEVSSHALDQPGSTARGSPRCASPT